MSIDPLKSYGQTQVGGPQRAQRSQPVAPPKETGASKESSGAAQEAFTPTAEASESPEDQKAGEAKAAQILGSWDPSSQASPVSSSLAIQGNQNVNQVHGVVNGQYNASPGPKPGFSEATVYSTKPPIA